MMLIVALETSVLIKHAKSNVSQIRIVQREKNVLMISVLFHGVKRVIKNQVTSNFTCLQQNSIILAKKLENIILKTKLFTSIQINPYFHAFGSKSYMNEYIQ